MSDSDNSDNPQSGEIEDNTDEIIRAIRDIVSSDVDMLEDDPQSRIISEDAEARLRVALLRLTGAQAAPPTLLEALVLEQLEPLLHDWLERNLAPLVERLVREEIRRITNATLSPDETPPSTSSPEGQ